MPARHPALARAFAAESWQALSDQLGSLSAQVIPASGPGLIDQLAAARATGLAVPKTVVSTDPAAAARRLGSQKVIVKALHRHFVEASPGLLSGVFPEITDTDSIRPQGRPRGVPVVVQEYVPHEAEIRCYYVRGQILTFAVQKADPMAPWLAPKAVKATQVDPPPQVAAATKALAKAMAVRYGALDFLIAGGTPVFLELNWAGDWRWIETRARVQAVTVAVTAMLHELHHNTVTNALSTEPGQRQGRIDLIRFLSGGSRAGPS